MTHTRRLVDAEEPLVRFLAETDALGAKRVPLLVQMPPSLAFDAGLTLPIYFVLGNHDFYWGGIARFRAGVTAQFARSPRLTYLTQAGVVALTKETGMVGQDGWSNGRLGDYARSGVLLNDYRLIEELAALD